MSKSTNSVGDSLVAIAVLLLLMPVGWAVTGLCGSYVWEWFAVPALGVPPISGAQAVGLAFVVGAYSNIPRKPPGAPDYSAAENIAWGISILFGRLFALGIAGLFYLVAIK